MSFIDDLKEKLGGGDNLSSILARMRGEPAPEQQAPAPVAPPAPMSSQPPVQDFVASMDQKAYAPAPPANASQANGGDLDSSIDKGYDEQSDMEDKTEAPKSALIKASPKDSSSDLKAQQDVATEDIKSQVDKEDADKKAKENEDDSEDDNSSDEEDKGPEKVGNAPVDKSPIILPKSLAEQFRDAQSSRANAQDTAMWSKIGAQLGGAIGRQSKDVIEGNIGLADMVAKRGDRPMEQLQQQMEFQKHDPNSEYSQAARNFLKQKFNVDLPPGITAEQLSGTFMGPALKSFEADQGRQMAMAKLESEHDFKDAELKQRLAENHLKLEEAIRNHQDTADIRRQQQEIMKMQYENKKDENDTKREEKLDKDAHGRLDKLGKLVTGEVASSRSAFGRAANNIRSADAALNLADQYKGHENDMDSRQIAEFARSLDALLSQGAPSVSGMDKLIPKTLTGKARSFEEFLTNEPKGAKQAAFIQRARETIEREKALAQKQLSTTQGKLFAPYRDLAEHPKYGQQFNDILPPGITADMLFKKPGKDGASVSDQSDVVNVISPEGKSGTIPKANLEKAIAKGFKVVQ